MSDRLSFLFQPSRVKKDRICSQGGHTTMLDIYIMLYINDTLIHWFLVHHLFLKYIFLLES